MDENEKATFDNRSSLYGPGTEGHTNLGLEWTGIIQNHYGIKLEHPLPPDVVLIMMAVSKCNRAVRTVGYHADNYIDGKIYLEMARDARIEEGKNAES